jgi:hypothetical protein
VQRRVRLDNLRGMDPVTLEVTVTDALRRPLGQLEPATLVDLLALGDADLPPSLNAAASRFRDRIAREITDIPDGPPWVAFPSKLGEVNIVRVPTWLRERIAEEATRETRPPISGRQAEPLLASWVDLPPEPFALGNRGVRVARAAAAPAPDAPQEPRARRAAGEPRAAAAPKPKRVAPVLDEERAQRLIQIVQERLAHSNDGGLSEAILLISVRKQAQVTDPAVSPADVTAAIRALEARGVVKRSAGRVSLSRRW